MPELLDLAADLRELTRLAAECEDLDRLLAHALDGLASVVPYDLAAVLELRDGALRVRVARGPLATRDLRGHTVALAGHATLRRALDTRRPVALGTHDHAGEEGDPYDGVVDLEHGHSCMVVPLYASDRSLGVITFDRAVCRPYPDAVVELAGVYGQIVGLAFLLAEQARLLARERSALTEQNRLLRIADHRSEAGADLHACPSGAMRQLVAAARQVAVTDVPVLVRGETGVGKELVAQAIHDWSPRAKRPFVKLNCAALPEHLVESELFGHVRGAFSGAAADRPGRFATANGGTLLLDEVGDLPLGAQAKLLRVLQEGTYEPLGADRTVKVDVRVIAATHVDLEAAVRAGVFREDLYYRLALFPIEVAPLRARPDDLPVIAERFLHDLACRTGRGPWQLDPLVARRLQVAEWPGNVRELVNLLERATILEGPGTLHLPGATVAPRRVAEVETDTSLTLDEVQREHIERVLAETGGRVYGEGGAAARLGLKPSTLQSRMRKLGVSRVAWTRAGL